MAEVLAKATLLRGMNTALAVAKGTGAEALVVDGDGKVRTTPGFLRFTGAEPVLAGRVS